MEGVDRLPISNKLLSIVLLFSALTVWSHWNLFSEGVFVFGINTSLFWIGVAFLLLQTHSVFRLARDWTWLIPIFLIVLSFSLYENPWLKLISFLVLPVAVGVFCAYSQIFDREKYIWNSALLGVLYQRLGIVNSIAKGILILLPVASLALVLLTSADEAFNQVVLRSVDQLFAFINWTTLIKFWLSVVLAIALFSMRAAWSGPVAFTPAYGPEKPVDGVIAGIVLGGLLLIYCSFLYLQLDHLVISVLPTNFREAELMVKSGFWQLFVLALLNVGLFLVVYKKTNWVAQLILRIFIVASSLLMVSAAWKVGLYSYTFGLSYEKIFAVYTALFGIGVLLYLVVVSFFGYRRNVVRVIVFAALWGYGVATISPVEKIIFYANIYLVKQENTRITLNQLSQLSLDIMKDVEQHDLVKLSGDSRDVTIWSRWHKAQIDKRCDRPWFERNLTVVRSCV